MRRALAATAAGLLLLGPAACGGDDTASTPSTVDPSAVTTTAATAEKDLPPKSALALESIYGDDLAAVGLKLTDRGGLIDRTGGGYESSPTGTHLALYVQPIGDRTIAQYIDGIRSVGAIFATVFDKWPGLESFDVCQEPVPSTKSTSDSASTYQGGEPLPVTQIELTRAQADAIDFDAVSVVDLVRLSRQDPHGLELRVGGAVARDPGYQAIRDAAR